MKKKLYVGCALKLAPSEFVGSVLALKDGLRADFEVLDFHGFRESRHNIYAYDMGQLARCEAMLAICDHPSFGLGFEVARVLSLGRPVVAVARLGTTVSGFIDDMPEVEQLFSFFCYQELGEVLGIARRELL